MRNDIIKSLIDKNIAILGFGLEGKSTYNYIRKYLPDQKITILDGSEKVLVENPDLIKDNVELVLGDTYLDHLDMFDVIIKSPGVVLKEGCEKYIDKITSQMSLVLEQTDTFVIGVTGTKGKSTTSSLIYQVLKDQEVDTILAGNIGLPILDYVDDIKRNTIVVAEMSSYQLEYVRKSPKIGIILNLFEEHLDHHGTLENYYKSKMNMFKYQTSNDYALYFSDNKTLDALLKENCYHGNFIKAFYTKEPNYTTDGVYCDYQNVYYKENDKIETLYNLSSERNLVGMHNVSNIMFALTIAKILHLDMRRAVETVNTFKPLKHRLENLGAYKGVIFYDDAIATIPEATISAIYSLENIDTVIIGGMDRGINYDGFAEELLNTEVNNFICLPDTGHNIANDLQAMKITQKIYIVEELDEAVDIAFKVTKSGTGCLLSPAAPSYNKYKNFAAKGDHFVELLQNYK